MRCIQIGQIDLVSCSIVCVRIENEVTKKKQTIESGENEAHLPWSMERFRWTWIVWCCRCGYLRITENENIRNFGLYTRQTNDVTISIRQSLNKQWDRSRKLRRTDQSKFGNIGIERLLRRNEYKQKYADAHTHTIFRLKTHEIKCEINFIVEMNTIEIVVQYPFTAVWKANFMKYEHRCVSNNYSW